MSAHPDRCRGCRGTGRQPGPPIVETVQGRPHRYTTVKRCEHDWYRDDPGYDAHTDEPLAADSTKATTAADTGYELGQHDLWVMSGGQLGKQHPNARQDIA